MLLVHVYMYNIHVDIVHVLLHVFSTSTNVYRENVTPIRDNKGLSNHYYITCTYTW